jgi:hypothetical protein
VDAERCLKMVVVIAMHGTYDAKIVSALGDVWEQVGYFQPRLAARF